MYCSIRWVSQSWCGRLLCCSANSHCACGLCHLVDLPPPAQIDLRSGEERAADKASKLAAVSSPAQISVTAQAGRSLEQGHAPDGALEHISLQQGGPAADNEVAAAAADTDNGKDGPQTASLIVHHVALLDKCVALPCLPSI